MGKKKRGRRSRKRPPRQEMSVRPEEKTKSAPLPQKRSLGKKIILGVFVCIVAAAAGIFLLRPGRNDVTRDREMNVLLVTLDTLRADRVGCYGYREGRTPNMDELARDGVLFLNATCQVPLTLPSHASILTGLYPTAHGVHNNGTYTLSPEHVTLAEVLTDAGFLTAAFTASFSVDSRFGVNQGFEVYDDSFQQDSPFKPLNSERRAEDVFASFSSWLDRNVSEKFFAWVHFFDPHLPYDPPPGYLKDFINRPYDGEVAYMDHYIGEIVRSLRAKGLLGRTLIILAGDHGEAFGERGEAGHGIFLYEMAMQVPFILYAENRIPAGKIVRSRVRLIDIFPTILDMLDLSEGGGGGVDGTSLIPIIEGQRKKDLDSYLETFYPRENHGWSELLGLVSGKWKYIEAPRPELYDLDDDPEEIKNLIAAESDIAAQMKKILEEIIQKGTGMGSGGRTLTAEEEERLRSLGYIQFAGGKTGGDYPDPKDKIDEMRLYQEAQGHEFSGNFRDAEVLYAKLLDLYPSVPASYINLALIQARQMKFDAAIATLKRGTEAVPNSDILLARLGHTYLVTGRPAEAFEAMKKVLEINPTYLDALTASAVILDASGRREEARTYIARALEVEPENRFLRIVLAKSLANDGRATEAIRLYEALVLDFPEDATLHQDLGIAYGISGDFAQAKRSLEKAIDLEATPTALFNLAVAYRETGDLEKAISALELYLRDPGDDDVETVRSVRAELERLRRQLK